MENEELIEINFSVMRQRRRRAASNLGDIAQFKTVKIPKIKRIDETLAQINPTNPLGVPVIAPKKRKGRVAGRKKAQTSDHPAYIDTNYH